MHVLIPALHRPTHPTGVCRHAANLAQCLAAIEGISRITLAIGQWQTQYFQLAFDLASPKIEIESIEIANRTLARNRWYIFGLPNVAERLRVDLVHVSFPIPFVRRWFQSRIATSIHDLYPYECPENFGYPRVWFNRWFLESSVSQSDGLCCVSETTQKSLELYFPGARSRKPISVVYNYVDFAAPSPTVPAQLQSDPPESFVLCVAQHRKNKNLDILIESFAQLARNHRLSADTILVLVGSPGPETERIEALVRDRSLAKRVTFLSRLSDRELAWLYDRCTLFVIPSSREGFCLPLVEALAFGCRVVCSNIPIFREVGASLCYYFDLHTDPVKALSDRILVALSHPRLEASALEARFTKPAIARQLLDFYAQIPTLP
ncbi:MAG: glycosyltransferase family 1 protein [Cyanobacteria bacterium J06639_1]